MKRAILVPAIVAGTAIDELKAWLAITTSGEDAALTALLGSALETCEAFTGQMPLEATCEEMLAPSGTWQRLQTRPVQSIESVASVAADNTRSALAPEDYEIDLDADGGASVRILQAGAAGRVAVRFTAGMAGAWQDLPESLRHGVLRLAAHAWREREDGAPRPVPPAAIAALWRPWRAMRLA